ncbi:phage baseplate plug family protein [Raoultella ornithinolytica]|uniref:phage baseplate plug family protein n=1 Tax=Raoultella ornithinolytica TaxID=54291 RepID=UPI0010CFD394|nr:hypothetical protein [Raoultella ornithinolytica]VTN40652.1 Uncharacterised protein [Raoultella ornithinolytica]
MQEISLSPSLSQKVYVTLGGQNALSSCISDLPGFNADLYVDDKPIFQGVLCLNCVYLVRYKYLGSVAIWFSLTRKVTADPYYDEIGTRFKLYYATKQ